MTPIVSIIMGSTSDLPVMEKACQWLNDHKIAFAALPGVIAASTTLPVIGVPIKGMLDGLDAMLSIIQMPPGIPVATVGVNAAQNAAILAAQIIALSNKDVAAQVAEWKASLGQKIEKANADLAQVNYEYKCN